MSAVTFAKMRRPLIKPVFRLLNLGYRFARTKSRRTLKSNRGGNDYAEVHRGACRRIDARSHAYGQGKCPIIGCESLLPELPRGIKASWDLQLVSSRLLQA